VRKLPSLGPIFFTVLLDLLGFGLVLPFLAEEARDTFGTTAFVGTLLAAVYSLMQFLFVPVWGRLSDRVGRRPVLLWSVGATALGMLALGCGLAWGTGVWILFFARAWSGIATANLGTASAYIADVTPPEDRARGMGLIGMAFGIGFILGPGIGGALSDITVGGRHGPLACFVAAGLSAINFAWVLAGVPESLPPDMRAAKEARSLAPLNTDAARAAFALPGFAHVVVINFIMILSFTNLDQTFRYFHKDLFSMTPIETGIVLAFIGVVAALVQGTMMRPLSRRFDESALIRAGAAMQGAAFAGLAIAPSIGRAALYGFGALLAVGNGITMPSVSAYVSKRADARSQGNTLGTNQSFASLARMLGPAFGGYLYTAVGPRSPYVAASIGMTLAFVVALRLGAARAEAAPAG
jgi:MFS family permease